MSDVQKSLRELAEEKLTDGKYPLKSIEARENVGLIEELRIHQVELEMQNEELRRSQEETEKARRSYEELWELSPAGHVIFDESGYIKVFNRSAQELFGRNRDVLPGSRFTSLLSSDDQVPVHLLLERLTEGEISSTLKVRLVGPDGSFRTCKLFCKSFTGESGKQIIQAVLTDISELQKARDELELRVQERTAELENANVKLIKSNKQLEELNKELQDFAYIASHDLQAPLRKIQAFGDMLVAEYAPSLDETFEDYLNRMQKAAERMKNLINSLLTYSRVAIQVEPPKETDLGESVEKALSNLEIMIREKKALVDVRDLPTIKADPVQMIQLFQNLIANALKFQSEDRTPHVKVYARLKDDEGAYEICVEDNGIGFREEYLNKIFLPFQRLLGGSSGYEGMGMGLAICKKIVERHGGKITAKSELGKGATFIVSFPPRGNGVKTNI